MRLRLGGVPEHFNAPIKRAAKTLSNKHNIQLHYTPFDGGTGAMCKALRNHEIDAAIALTEGLTADLLRGNPSKLLATYVSTPLVWGVHVPKASPLLSLDQLDATARFAVSRMGSGSHLMACVDAHARGRDPTKLNFEVVGSLEGARSALSSGAADVFMWEKFTTKFLVDSGEWRRIGEVPTPWPCFSVAATDRALSDRAPELLLTLEVLRAEAESLRADVRCCEIIAHEYQQQEADIREWISGVRWDCRPVVDQGVLSRVMQALVEAQVLEKGELAPPSQLVSSHTSDVS